MRDRLWISLFTTFFLLTFNQLATAQTVTAETVAADTDTVEVEPLSPLGAAILERIESDEGAGAEAGDVRLLALMDHYDLSNFEPIWVTDEGATNEATRLIVEFEKANLHALNPADYDPAGLREKLAAKSTGELADLEVSLSSTLVTYAHHLRAGRVEPNRINRQIKIFPEGPDPRGVLGRARDADDMGSFLAGLQPETPRYDRLKAKLAEFRALRDAGTVWTTIETGNAIKPDMDDPRVPALRQRLIEAGDLAEGVHDGTIYDGALVEAVEKFQARHGIDVDGIIGGQSYDAMNVSLEDRIAQMEINLERRRWMPDNMGDYYIFVNLADQFLKVVRYDKTVDRERTIHTALTVVGKPYHSTPVFSELMTYAELNPNWNVPYSIATKEYLPKLKRNPGVLPAQNIRVLSNGREISPYAVNWSAYSTRKFPFRLQQKPGPKNALGRVKFMFPNEYNIYIHDTPSKTLFSRTARAFSHGCVRVQNPLDLAEVLLSPEGYDRAKINAVVKRGKRRVVKFKKPIPVHITYLTAWVNKDGSVHFRRDIYGRDKVLAGALNKIQLAAAE